MSETRLPKDDDNRIPQSVHQSQGILHSGKGDMTIHGPVTFAGADSKTVSDHRDIAADHRDIVKKQMEQALFEEKQECHQLFRLTSGDMDTTYEWYKNRVEDRVPGTCQWFLNHEHFQTWLKQDSDPLLVSADPGCGKSVLSKYLINERLPQSASICYFFFKDQDQNTIRQALCALLHQLFSHRPSLIEYALPEYKRNGKGLISATELLWDIFEKAAQDPQTGPLIIVLDALDECAELQFRDLIRKLKRLFHRSKQDRVKIKWLVTSRPYEQIVSEFRELVDTFPYIRIPGEDESETISQEVNHVIKHRVEQLAKEKELSDEIKQHLAKRLLEIPHRTYLWVYLVFDDLKNEGFTKTKSGINSAIATLPENVNQAYEKILSRSKDKPMVRKVLSVVLAASRPLTLTEMNFAVNTDSSLHSITDLELEREEDFREHLRSWCGLFISVYHNKVYFLHQTAREFLLAAPPITAAPDPRWQHSITISQAHETLANACVVYLDFFNSEVDIRVGQHIDADAFLNYSAKNWGLHFREAGMVDSTAILPHALKIVHSNSKSRARWLKVHSRNTRTKAPRDGTGLLLASYFGHIVIVKHILTKSKIKAKSKEYLLGRALKKIFQRSLPTLEVDINAKDAYRGKTPLSWAAIEGHEGVVKLLLETGKADVNMEDNGGRTPLSWAAKEGHEGVVKLLLATGKADVNMKDDEGQTPLSWAALIGNEGIINILESYC